jgi:hypothetical protein
MKTIFSDKSKIIDLWIEQKQDFAGTPLSVITDSSIKQRRLFFKGDTIYSYRESYPLARLLGDKIYLREENYSRTTSKQKLCIQSRALKYNKKIIFSDDLKNENIKDKKLQIALEKLLKARLWKDYYIYAISNLIANNENNLITKSKFPLLFDEKHEKVKQMLFSQDNETVNLAIKIIKQEKLI